jgi:hypothetical protein
MDPSAAADVLRRRLVDPKRPMTVADASVASGLALRDAEAGLHVLTHEHRGHLRVTEDGDLVHVFPHGFTKPWESREAVGGALAATWRVISGVGRFVVRAWLLVAMVGYALVFLALLLGLTFARQGSDDRDGGAGFHVLGGILRAIGDALFWTFHPWSPVYVGTLEDRASGRARRGRDEERVPFYEKVNRFVFGPTAPPPAPHATRAKILEEIRAKRGRIGLADVMRVTGLPRHEADPLMARLMLDHEGTVEVGEQGGIVYRFEAMRRTADATPEAPRASRAAWETPAALPPLTGNTAGANAAIAALNGFNVLASAWAITKGLTIANVAALLFTRHPPGQRAPIAQPDDGLPIALGLIPLTLSLAIFALPGLRAALRATKRAAVARENARLAILREVLERAPAKEPVPDEALRSAYRIATGDEPSPKEITARVVELGGDVEVGPDGEVRYRFADLEAEAEALEEERARASAAEAKLGKVVFASDAE